MIDKNQAALLELIKNALFRTPADLPDDVDWDAVYNESVDQTVVSLVADSVPDEHSAGFKGAQLRCRAQFMRILFEQKKLVDLFAGENIPLIIIKGVGAAKYYPVPVDRVMGDIDLLVREEDYDRAKRLLDASGYSFDHEDETRHAAYYINGICVELHFRFSEDCPGLEEYLKGAFSDIRSLEINGLCFPVLPDAVNGLLILAHFRHHILAQGLGLRHLTDWETFVHAFPDRGFWTDTFMPMANACELTDFAAVTSRLCSKYLALTDDLSWCAEVDDPRLEFIMDYIFETGNFGTKNDEVGEEKPVENVSLKMKKALKNGSFFRMLQENGQRNWTACRKHPALKPFAFIYQAFRYLFRGAKAAVSGDVAKDLGAANKKFAVYNAFDLNKNFRSRP